MMPRSRWISDLHRIRTEQKPTQLSNRSDEVFVREPLRSAVACLEIGEHMSRVGSNNSADWRGD
jgi:hypothetical protein